MAKHSKRPRDPNQLAKVALDIGIGECHNDLDLSPERATSEAKGGSFRAMRMTPEQREDAVEPVVTSEGRGRAAV